MSVPPVVVDPSPSGFRGRWRNTRRVVGLVGAAALASTALGVFPGSASAATPSTTIFNSRPGLQAYTVPADVHALKVIVIGGKGGDFVVTDRPDWPVAGGGMGAKATGTVAVTPGQQLWINVPPVAVNGTGSGYGNGDGGPYPKVTYARGGGASDIRTSPTAPLTGDPTTDPRLMVAGGGGGGGAMGYGRGGFGGSAGSPAGPGETRGGGGGQPGTATAGGAGGGGGSGYMPGGPGGSGTAGSGGYGGPVAVQAYNAVGGWGGDGWFGGGGGGGAAYNYGGGGGGAGSSYASAKVSGSQIITDTAKDAPRVTITTTNFSGPLGSIIDGSGEYNWFNTNTVNFPGTFSLPSPKGTHQQSCSTLSGTIGYVDGILKEGANLKAFNTSTPGWNPSVQGGTDTHLRLTVDGNLQLFNDQYNQVLWSSSTAPTPGTPYPVALKLQTDGNLVIYSATDGHYMWDAQVSPSPCP